ncbi:hypothetical protein [Variovorax sp. GT1P44]|uniref:hypothetical protein n=1 Tax=Variovorax sp. GT1P44 TaxID=3443742 RepID=UPI003F447BE6
MPKASVFAPAVATREHPAIRDVVPFIPNHSPCPGYWHVHDAARVHELPVFVVVLLPVLQEALTFAGQLMSHPRQDPETGAEQ